MKGRTVGGLASRMALLVPVLATTLSAGGPTELPGIGAGTITPETLFEFTSSVKMIQPPPGLPQKWFSSQAEFTGTVTAATAGEVTVAERMQQGLLAGLRARVVGPSAAAGQVRDVTANDSSVLTVTPRFDPPPEPGDTVEVFTGQLPPGRWNGACTQADPCLDINEAYLLAAQGAVWLWFDSGDVWDADDEWCDFTHSPPGRCLDPDDPFRHRILVEEYEDAEAVHEIRWGVSGTDLTGETYAVFDCDSEINYPPYGGGVFESQNGSSAPPSQDHPTPWLVVQGMETRCWNRPAPGTLTQKNEWGEGASIYKREFSGKLLAIHNRHGALWDDAALVKGNGGNYTHGDAHVGAIVLVDVAAETADYSQMVGQCTATNEPYRSCQGTDFTGQMRSTNGIDIRPPLISVLGGGDVLWVGGDTPYRNGSGGPYTGNPRHFVQLGGFNDYFTQSGVGGSQTLTMVNVRIEGSADDLTAGHGVFVLPLADHWGTRFNVQLLNSRFSDLPDGAAVVRFDPGWAPNRSTDTSLATDWVNVEVQRYGAVFAKEHSSMNGVELDGGASWTGRCLFVDQAGPTQGAGNILDIEAGTEPVEERCARNHIDVQGWVDGDDVGSQFQLCYEDVVDYASEAMAGTMMQPGNPGAVNGWRIFADGNSGDWGGEGVDVDAAGLLPVDSGVRSVVENACDHTQIYPLGLTLPIGFLSTADNLIDSIEISGVRDLGYNDRWGAPDCVPPPSPLYIKSMDLDGMQRPVLNVSDSNPPPQVTGYNVYRSAAPGGPWSLIGEELTDQNPIQSGVQLVDGTGNVGDLWYYKVLATNGVCLGP